jgi:2-oxoglutarate ferredoxin oxidoreductase subunit beta
VLAAAGAHRGSAFVEIFQNCNIFNDNAFDFVREEKENRIYLEHGQPVRWGADLEKALRQHPDGSLEVVGAGDSGLLVHDVHHESPGLAFALSRVTQETAGGTPVGVFRDVERPVYDELMSEQLATAVEKRGEGDLGALLHSGETWTIR